MTRSLPALLLLSCWIACVPAARAAATRAFVLQSDFFTGSLSTADLAPRTLHCDVASVGSDASMRFYAGGLWVVNRYGGDNVQEIDPATGGTLFQFSVGNGSNPHDIAFASPTRAYVSRFESSDLWIVNPVNGVHTGTISLAAYADADGVPEMDRMTVVGPYVFVSLERVDRNNGFQPTDTALVAVIDTRADTLVDCDRALPGRQAIRLQLTNPFTAFQYDGDGARLLIGCAGRFGFADGGIERIDPVTLRSDGVAITEAALGGDVDDVTWGDAEKSWAIVADAGGVTHLVAWSPKNASVMATLWTPGGYALTDAERNDGGELWVCDSGSGSPRVRVFSTVTDAPVGSDLVCVLPPVAVAFDVASGQTADVHGHTSGLRFDPPWPNPARGGARFAFELARPGELALDVFDAAGRHVRSLASGPRAAGRADVAWNLADDLGRRVPAGLYLVRARSAAGSIERRLIVLR